MVADGVERQLSCLPADPRGGSFLARPWVARSHRPPRDREVERETGSPTGSFPGGTRHHRESLTKNDGVSRGACCHAPRRSTRALTPGHYQRVSWPWSMLGVRTSIFSHCPPACACPREVDRRGCSRAQLEVLKTCPALLSRLRRVKCGVRSRGTAVVPYKVRLPRITEDYRHHGSGLLPHGRKKCLHVPLRIAEFACARLRGARKAARGLTSGP